MGGSNRGRIVVTQLPAQGEVWWCEAADIGRRPVVVLSQEVAISRLRRALVAPCTTNIRGLASEVVLVDGSSSASGPQVLDTPS